MLISYLKLAVRNLLKNKTFSLITILGLAAGLATGILILAYVLHEMSFDTFHENAENKYRIIAHAEIEDEPVTSAATMVPLGPEIKEEIPGIQNYVRIYKASRAIVKYNDKIFYEDHIHYADSTFLSFFSFKLSENSDVGGLSAENSVYISAAAREKYYGTTNPMGSMLEINGVPCKVVGTFVEMPSNSHLQFDFVCSFQSLGSQQQEFMQQWLSLVALTYIEIKNDVPLTQIEEAINGLVEERIEKQASAYGIKVALKLQPLTNIRFENVSDPENPGEHRNKLWVFGAVAVFIILIACINFMTLTTARAYTRAKEIGIKKILGAQRQMLIIQFLGESLLISFIALFIALAMIEFLLPVFNMLFDKDLTINYFTQWQVFAGLIIITFLVGIIAGSYPSFYLSGMIPFRVLKSVHRPGKRARQFRSMLVMVQFVISIVLICNTLVIYKQLNYLNHKQLGFQKENVLIINLNKSVFFDKFRSIKTAFMEARGVENISGLTSYPGNLKIKTPFIVEGTETTVILPYYYIDTEFLNTFQVTLMTGKNFSGKWQHDSSAVLVNERFAKQFDWVNPVGKKISLPDYPGRKGVDFTIIGVVKDFHISPLHVAIEPLVMGFTESVEYMAVKISGQESESALADINAIWRQEFPDKPLDYAFLDNEFEKNYQSDRQLGSIFLFFTIIAIFIACLGLYGLGAFSTALRAKEIGIRKVLGASTAKIATILSQDFVRLIVISMVIAWPVSYIAMDQWLNRFAYRIEIPFWIFAASGIIALLVSLITIQYHTIKTANANPADAIRFE